MGDIRTIAQATGCRERRARPRRAPARPRRRGADRRARTRARVPRRRARVARPGLHRRPLDAAADRARGRHRRARLRRRALRAAAVGGRRRRRAGGRRRDAVRLRRRPLAARGRAPTPTSCATLGARRVVAVDASAYFSRPGPRLVDGLEMLAHVLHPELVPEAPGPVLRRRAVRARRPSAQIPMPLPPRRRIAPSDATRAGDRAAQRAQPADPLLAAGARLTREGEPTIAPPTRPPMWPPIETLGITKLSTRLKTISAADRRLERVDRRARRSSPPSRPSARRRRPRRRP